MEHRYEFPGLYSSRNEVEATYKHIASGCGCEERPHLIAESKGASNNSESLPYPAHSNRIQGYVACEEGAAAV